MADEEMNTGAAYEAVVEKSLIGRKVRISPEAKDTGTDNLHFLAGMYGEITRPSPFSGWMVTVGKKTKHFDLADLELLPESGGDAAAETPPAAALTSSETRLVIEPPLQAINSPTNPRRRRGLDVDSLRTLADNIITHGLAQPILVRPLPSTRLEETAHLDPRPAYEVIAGERRWRAAQLAGLTSMPFFVREMSDQAVLEIQLVENIEREDLDAMEEAEGFALLREKLGYTVEQIAERIGKGKGASYVRKTMKLLDLTPTSRDAMYDGHLGRSTGLLVARYPADRQAAVVAYIMSKAIKTPTGTEPLPYRQIAPEIFTRFNTELKGAPFDTEDTTLVIGAGACSACPKRTGGSSDLFGDAPNAPEACADETCFEFKRQANLQRIREKAQAEGFKVIDGAEAAAAKPTAHSRHLTGLVRLTDTAYTETGLDGQEREVTFDDALRGLGKKAPKPRVFIDPHTGAAEKVITLDLANKLTPAEEPTPPTGKQKAAPVDTSPPEVQAFRDPRVRHAVLFRIFDVIRGRERTLEELQHIARVMFLNGEEIAAPRTEEYLGWTADLEDKDPIDVMRITSEKINALPAYQLGEIIAMAAVEQVITGWGYGDAEQDQAVIASYGVDVLAVRDKVAEDLERQQDSDANEERQPDAGDATEEAA